MTTLYRTADMPANAIGAFAQAPHKALYIYGEHVEIDTYGVIRTPDGLLFGPNLIAPTATALYNGYSKINCVWQFALQKCDLVIAVLSPDENPDTAVTMGDYYDLFLNTGNHPIPEPRGINAPAVVKWDHLSHEQARVWLKNLMAE